MRIPTVRFYRGEPIPWKVHDCDESNSCSFCRAEKRKFAAAWKAKNSQVRENPQVTDEDREVARKALNLWGAVLATRIALAGDGCYECGEVAGSTMALVQLVADGIVTEEQLRAAVKKAPKLWDAGILPGRWEKPS